MVEMFRERLFESKAMFRAHVECARTLALITLCVCVCVVVVCLISIFFSWGDCISIEDAINIQTRSTTSLVVVVVVVIWLLIFITSMCTTLLTSRSQTTLLTLFGRFFCCVCATHSFATATHLCFCLRFLLACFAFCCPTFKCDRCHPVANILLALVFFENFVRTWRGCLRSVAWTQSTEPCCSPSSSSRAGAIPME